MKHITIKDVAQKLNVSISTISRAFNDKYDIRKETRSLILQTAEEMGYFPNPIAQKLSQKKTFNIGVVVPEFVNEFYAEISMAIQEVFISKGFQVLIMQSDERPDLELKNVKTLIHNMVDGLIIAPTSEGENMEFYMKQLGAGYPIVFLNRVLESINASKVLFNNKKWAFFATEHLIRQNFKKIYHLSGYKNLCVSTDRIKGFKQAMAKHKVPKENFRIIETGLLAKEGIAVVEDLIYKQDLPDAFFCVNDQVAIGIMNTLKRNGYSIPEDIGVMGFTETGVAELFTPGLSSVKQPTFEMGKIAANLLLKHIENESVEPETIVMNGNLNIRESSTKELVT